MRNALIVSGAVVVAVIVGTLLFLYGGENFSNKNYSIVTTVPFTELAHGTQSDVATRTNYLITSASELEKLWKMIDAKGNPPVVDFAKSAVAAVFAGQKMTGGYAIAVSKVTDAQDRVVTITLSSPDSTCLFTQSITAPYQIIKLPKTSLSFTHEDQTATTSCSQ